MATYPKVYLGEPSFIKVNRKTYKKEDTFIQFKRSENSNLLIAVNDMDSASTILGLALLQLINQSAKFLRANNFGGDKIHWRDRFKLIEEKFDSFQYFQKSDTIKSLDIAEEEIVKRKNDEKECETNFYLIILNLDSSFQKQGFSLSESSKKLINILKQGPDLGVHTLIYTYSSKSVINSGIEPELFENKILLKGDSTEIIRINEGRKEPTKAKMAYLYAPTPVTTLNPDLFNIYSQMEENKMGDCNKDLIEILKEFLKDME